MSSIDLEARPGWIPVARDRARGGRSFVSGDPQGERLRLAYFREGEAGPLVARAWFGPLAEGPPGHAHGGSQAAVLDESVGGNCWLQGYPVLAGTLTVRYRRPLPLDTSVTVRTWITSVEGRKVFCGGHIEGSDGNVYSEAEAVFIIMKDELRQNLFDAARAAGRANDEAY